MEKKVWAARDATDQTGALGYYTRADMYRDFYTVPWQKTWLDPRRPRMEVWKVSQVEKLCVCL